MYQRRITVLMALGTALFFSLLCFLGVFELVECRIYDMFLRFRPGRERYAGLVFLNVDDLAVAHIGVFPWPRSVMAGGFLRLKEYGVRAAILDIEYVDRSPARIDEIYFRDGLRTDIAKSVSEVAASAGDLIDALALGQIRLSDARLYSEELLELAGGESERLYQAIRRLRQDDDAYLAAAASLFGRAWFTLNIQGEPLSGEQAERRARTEELFSLPLERAPDAFNGGPGADILPAIPPLMEAARGAGFTNIVIDRDGVRRRLNLVRRVGDFWYRQLAFAPLLEYLGNPRVELRRGELVLRGARLPAEDAAGVGIAGNPAARSGQPAAAVFAGGNGPLDIRIPLDREGAMLLDWPKTSYFASYTHVSFAEFSRMEEAQTLIIQYLSVLALADNGIFPFLERDAAAILAELDFALAERQTAMDELSDARFAVWLERRDRALDWLAELIAAPGDLDGRTGELAARYPDQAELVYAERDRSRLLLGYLETVLDQYRDIDRYLRWNLAGKFCIIGRADTGTTDIGVNPFHAEYINVGTHAALLDTVLSGAFIRTLSPWWSILLCFLPAPLLLAGIYRFKPGLRIFMGIGGAILIALLSWTLFIARGIFLGPLGPVLTIIVALIVQESLAFVRSDREKQFIRKAFSTYLASEVVNELISDPSRLQLGGAKRHMTAVFTDIQGFSTISERLDPEELVRLLNSYLSAMSDVLLAGKGTIDKYEGDAIMAFFGAPVALPDHALRAVTAAVHMKRLERELNVRYTGEGLSPSPLRTRIGINTGSMVVGNMGTERKMDYTVMGNAVNLASRLEGVNKQYGTWILASEATVLECGEELICRKLDRIRVVGIQEPVRVYEIMELASAAPPALKEKAALFGKALPLFEARDWTAAKAAFERVLELDAEDGPAKICLERCEQFRKKPPDSAWDGVFNLNEK